MLPAVRFSPSFRGTPSVQGALPRPGFHGKGNRRPPLHLLAPKACRSNAGPGSVHALHSRVTHGNSCTRLQHGTAAAPQHQLAHAMRGRPLLAADAAVALMTNESLTTPFLWANSGITYAWVLLILAPRWDVTKAIFKSDAVVVLLCCSFLYFFVAASLVDSSSSEDLTAKVTFLFTEAITDPAKMATLATPAYIAQDWVHVLVWDFIVGRYIWLEALERELPMRHSLLCIFTFGPVGLLVHLMTKAVVESWRERQVQP